MPVERQRWILAARAALLVGAVAGVAVGLAAARRPSGGAREERTFACPMHAGIRSHAPGACPVCGMALREAGGAGEEDAVDVAALLAQGPGAWSPNLVGDAPAAVRRRAPRAEVFAPAWIERDGSLTVLVYRDQLPNLTPGELVVFSPTARPDEASTARRVDEPPAPWDDATARVRFTLAPARAVPLRTDTVGWARFEARPRTTLVVPAGAVVRTENDAHVLVRTGSAIRARAVELGRTTAGTTAVLSGLSPREQVATTNVFFWDAERRLARDRR